MTDLDRFETALLTQLRDVVTERAPTVPAAVAGPNTLPAQTRGHRGRRRLAAAAAVVAACGLAVPGLLASPAYSVSEGNDGTVTVRVTRLDDTAGLERQLADHGIRADVTFLANGRICADGRYRAVDRSGRLESAVGDSLFEIRVGPGAVRDGETLVVAASFVPVPRGQKVWLHIGIARSAVLPCREVPWPDGLLAG